MALATFDMCQLLKCN